MQLKVLGSNSSGNCYILSNEDVTIILECGIPFMEVKKALGFNISKVAACFMTHSHGDHSKYCRQFLDAGIPVYTSQETIDELKFKHHNFRPMTVGAEYIIGGFGIIKSFEVAHDVFCVGFLFDTVDGGRSCFITDTHWIPVTFRGLTNVMIECNFGDTIIDESGIAQKLRQRILSSHLSFDICVDWLKKVDLRKCNNIVLLHLSDKNSDAAHFQKEISLQTGKQVHIARPGAVIDFKTRPF